MEFHSEDSQTSDSRARTPWNVQLHTGDQRVIPTFRMFANVRMNLLPYIFSEARRSATTGVPLMRAMALAFPDDAATALLDQQYLFGEQLLVAPVVFPGARPRMSTSRQAMVRLLELRPVQRPRREDLRCAAGIDPGLRPPRRDHPAESERRLPARWRHRQLHHFPCQPDLPHLPGGQLKLRLLR